MYRNLQRHRAVIPVTARLLYGFIIVYVGRANQKRFTKALSYSSYNFISHISDHVQSTTVGLFFTIEKLQCNRIYVPFNVIQSNVSALRTITNLL